MPIQPINSQSVKKLPQEPISFPPAWLWFVDELVPAYVKKNYSPRESWKDKPFAKEDVQFFSKGVLDLSELFTSDRPIGPSSKLPSYFLHPKFRSAYLLYFLSLQMAKFITLYERHPEAVASAIENGQDKGLLRIADLGAGPGTASIGFLLHLLALKTEIPPIELIWFDTNRHVMEDGKALAEALASQFPRLRGKVKVTLHADPWWTAPQLLGAPCSLILVGHVLNEARQIPGGAKARRSSHSELDIENDIEPSSEIDEDFDSKAQKDKSKLSSYPPHPVWQEIWSLAEGGGMLIVEPASKGASQSLARLRDQLLEHGVVDAEPTSIWGPCLHAQACPMSQGRDWCHFSVPVKVPGKWFRMFSEALSSERQWLKYSYLWLAAPEYPGPQHDPQMRRVLSDPMSASKEHGEVLLCEPGQTGRVASPIREPLWRGDLILLKKR